MHWTQSIKSAAKDAAEDSVDHLVGLITRKWRKHNFCEWLPNHPLTTTYFDADKRIDGTEEDIDEAIAALLRRCMEALAIFFADQPTFTLESVIWGTSHGPKPGGKYKLSFRAYVPRFCMHVDQIKLRLQRLGLCTPAGEPFDHAPYGVNQKLRMFGSFKANDDRRILQLMGSPEEEIPDDDVIRGTIVQNVGRDAIRIEEVVAKAPAKRKAGPAPKPGKRSAKQPLAIAAAVDEEVVDTPGPVEPVLKRGRPFAKDVLPAHVRAALEATGFKEIRGTQKTEAGWHFDCCRKSCPLCMGAHDSNQFWAIYTDTQQAIRVGNYSEACRNRVISLTAAVEPIRSLNGSLTDSMLAIGLQDSTPGMHLIPCEGDNCLVCNKIHGGAHEYRTAKLLPQDAAWSVAHVSDMCTPRIFHHSTSLPDYLEPVLTTPNYRNFAGLFIKANGHLIDTDAFGSVFVWYEDQRKWKRDERGSLASRVGDWLDMLLDQVGHLDGFSQRQRAIKAARASVANLAQMQGITKHMLNRLRDAKEPAEFDANPLLLGTNDGVVDLTALTFRPAEMEDRITRSVGYNFEDGTTAADVEHVERIMHMIYPVDEEYEVAQRWAGYCLRGDVPVKHFVILTDRRGGHNGKSTFLRALRDALGSYAFKPEDSFLYQTSTVRDTNAHTAGLLQFQHKRLAAFEELSATKRINMGLLKDITGGGTTLPVRAPHATEAVDMTWTSKVTLAFNEGSAPQLRADDEAFCSRILVIPHRSHFAPADKYARLKDEPHTFLASPPVMRAGAILRWAMEGLRRFNAKGLTDVPEGCRSWVSALVEEQDELIQWAQGAVSVSAEEHFTAAEALAEFSKATGSKLGKGTFIRRLQQHLHTELDVSFYVRKTCGSAKKTSVFWGFALLMS